MLDTSLMLSRRIATQKDADRILLEVPDALERSGTYGDLKRQLQRAGLSTTSAEALLERMLDKVDELCAERDKLKKSQPGPTKGKVLGGRLW